MRQEGSLRSALQFRSCSRGSQVERRRGTLGQDRAGQAQREQQQQEIEDGNDDEKALILHGH
jgi:hypothetical protein